MRRRLPSHNERVLRAALRRFVAGNWRPLLVVVLGWTALMFFDGWLLNGYLAGLVQGILTAALLLGIFLVFLLSTGQSLRLSGKWGEDNTRDVLKRAARRRLIHGWVDNLEIQGGDVDHLVVTRWGVLAIDSKWHGHRLTGQTVTSDEDRAEAAARRAKSILRSLKHSVDVTTAVVIWGGQQSRVPPGGIQRGDVHFVAGHNLRRWLQEKSNVSEATISRSDAQKLLQDLHDFRRRVRPA